MNLPSTSSNTRPAIQGETPMPTVPETDWTCTAHRGRVSPAGVAW